MTIRQYYLKRLSTLRKRGWEHQTYGIHFDEQKATDTQLQLHVILLEKRRKVILRQRLHDTYGLLLLIILTIILITSMTS